MTVGERNKHLRVVAELLRVHLPAALRDQPLARDLMSVVSVSLRAAYEDAMKSADVWDTKHYHVRADQLRDEWTWALAAANTAEGLAYRDAPLTAENLQRLEQLIGAPLEVSSRRVIRNPEAFRGAARANRELRRTHKGGRTLRW